MDQQDMSTGDSRNGSFVAGSESVRQPEFSSMQQQHRIGYQRTSLLDNLQPSGNGYGSADRQRLVLGVNNSANGQSSGNFDDSLWLRPYKSPDLYSMNG